MLHAVAMTDNKAEGTFTAGILTKTVSISVANNDLHFYSSLHFVAIPLNYTQICKLWKII